MDALIIPLPRFRAILAETFSEKKIHKCPPFPEREISI
jgi:hypothetical protein